MDKYYNYIIVGSDFYDGNNFCEDIAGIQVYTYGVMCGIRTP